MSAPRTAVVIGAGPAGPTAADLLLDAGVEVTVPEAFASALQPGRQEHRVLRAVLTADTWEAVHA